METIFSKEQFYYDELILEREVESSDDESECNENYFPIWHNCLFLMNNIIESLPDYILINARVNYN